MCKRIFVSANVLLVALISLLAGCQESTRSTPKSSEEPCFRVGYLDITASAPLFVAQSQDLFAQNDVCVEAIRFATSNQLVDALAAERLDYVVETSAVPALALHSRSEGRFFVTAASTISQRQPFDAIIARKDASITGLAGLSGKSIAVFPGTTARNLLVAFLQDQGVDTSAVEVIPTPPQNLLASVKSGAVDAAHVYEPAWALARNDPELEEVFGTVYGRQLAPNPQGVSLIRSGVARERPDDSRRLVAAFDEALRLMTAEEAAVRNILSREFELPGNAAQDMHLLYMSPSSEINWQSLEDYARLLVEVGELHEVPSIKSLQPDWLR